MNLTLLVIGFCTVASTAVAQTAPPPSVQQQAPRGSAAELQAEITKLRAAVQDPFATEAMLSTARRELQSLSARLNELVPIDPGGADPVGPVAAAQVEVRDLLASINGRIGRPGEPAGGVPRAVLASGLSVPNFDEEGRNHELANALRAAQMKLRDHLRSRSQDAKTTDDLVAEMIVAEERLAWQAAWPFTVAEEKELRALRAPPSVTAASPKGDLGEQNEIDRRVGDVYARHRARGVAIINARLVQEASSVGRATPPAFAIHRPTTRAGQRAVEQRLAAWIASEVGVKVQPGGPALLLLANGTRPFDDDLAAALRGDR